MQTPSHLAGGYGWLVAYIGEEPEVGPPEPMLVVEAGPALPLPPAPPREAPPPIVDTPVFAASEVPPLAAHHQQMRAVEAQHGLPAGLIWVVGRMESEGGKKMCAPFNAWGVMEWPDGPDSRRCRAFASWDESIGYVGNALAGWVGQYGLAGGLSVWVCGNPRDGLWYAAEVLALLP